MLLCLDGLVSDTAAFSERGQAPGRIVVGQIIFAFGSVRALIATLLVDLEEAVELHHRARCT